MPRSNDKVLVQVLFEPDEFQMIERLAKQSDSSVPHWVRAAARMRLGVVTIDAWGASLADNEQARLTREQAPHGNFLLRCLTPPLGGALAAEVQWVKSGRRGLTQPLTRTQLLSGELTPFDDFAKGKPADLYLRSAGFWRVLSVFNNVDDVGIIEMKRIAMTSNEYLEALVASKDSRSK